MLGTGCEGGRKKGDDFGFCEEGTGVPRWWTVYLKQDRKGARAVYDRLGSKGNGAVVVVVVVVVVVGGEGAGIS